MDRKRKPTVLEKLARSGPRERPPTAKEISRSLRTLRDASRELGDKPFKAWACLVDAEPKLLDAGVKAIAKAFGMAERTLWRSLLRLRDAGYIDLEDGRGVGSKTAVRVRVGQVAEARNHIYKVGASVLPDSGSQSAPNVVEVADFEGSLPGKTLNKRPYAAGGIRGNLTVDENSNNIRPENSANHLENAEESGPSYAARGIRGGAGLENQAGLSNRESDLFFSEGKKVEGAGLEPRVPLAAHEQCQVKKQEDPAAERPPEGPYATDPSAENPPEVSKAVKPLELPSAARSPGTGARVPKATATAARRRAVPGPGPSKLPAPVQKSRVDVGKLKRKASAAARTLEERARSGAVAPLPPGWKAGPVATPTVLYGFTVKGEDRETLLRHLARGHASKDRIAVVTALGTLARKKHQEWCHKRPDFRGVDVEHDSKHDKTWEKFGVGCFKGGLLPVQVFDYWADPEHNFTRMNNPAYSRAFVCSLKNLDTAWQDLKTERPASARGRPQKVDAFHAYDEKKIHPELRRTLEEAGHDVSDQTDRALMTIQEQAKDFAAGRNTFGAKLLTERAKVVQHLFETKE